MHYQCVLGMCDAVVVQCIAYEGYACGTVPIVCAHFMHIGSESVIRVSKSGHMQCHEHDV